MHVHALRMAMAIAMIAVVGVPAAFAQQCPGDRSRGRRRAAGALPLFPSDN